MNRFPIIHKFIISSLLSISVMMSLSSCHHHDHFIYDDSYSRGINTHITAVDEDGNTIINSGSTIGVYTEDEDGNITFQIVETDEHGNAVLPVVSEGLGLVAYLPYQESWDPNDIMNPGIFTVQSSQTSKELYDASNLMFASMGSFTRASSQITFIQALAKIVVKVTDETGSYNLPTSVLTLLDMNDSVEVFLKWLKVETIAESKQDIVTMNYNSGNDITFFKAIVAPQNIGRGTNFINFKVDNHNLFFSLPQEAELQSRQTYTCSLRLTDVGLVYDGSSITDWEDDGGDILDGEW